MDESIFRINIVLFLKKITVIIAGFLIVVLLLTKFEYIMVLSLTQIVTGLLRAIVIILPFYIVISLFLYFLIRIKITSLGVKGASIFFLPYTINWENISKYKIENQLGLKYLKLYRKSGLFAVWIPLYLLNYSGFCKALEAANPLGEEIVKRIGKYYL